MKLMDEKNWSSQSAEEYYATAEGYESLINGAYSTLNLFIIQPTIFC